ncbi:MAG: DUF4835 family protein, partial [Phaeodactylibacter sp.]|nr:DUF4835 family protein [Phaeodactylibacter sp.]
TPTLQIADPKVFEDLEGAITNFFNNQRWTSDEFEQEERINITVSMTITEEFSATSFKAELAIQSTRPVYGTDYETPTFLYNDRDVTFSYEPFQPIQFSENSFTDNLSQILSFYAFIVVGMDYDSFSPFGGEPYFQKAQDLLNAVPSAVSANNPGWRSLDGNRNRYWIMENLLSPRVRALRQAVYDYHRQGLDLMHKEVVPGRAIIAQALEQVFAVNQNYPNSMMVQIFANAKSNEIVDIFSQSTSTEKNRIVQIMTKIDAANSSKYRNMK